MGRLEDLDSVLSSCGVQLTDRQGEQILAYLSLLKKWRGRQNLTSVIDGGELLRFHFIEACWAASLFLPSRSTLADIGSGAGFPGMVMKLYQPSLRVSLIEKSYKKSVFLTQLAQGLSLEVDVFNGLAEDFSGWDQVDVAVIRALRPSPELLHLLSRKLVMLLIFHGREVPSLTAWHPEKRERFPLSRNRWATLYRAHVDM